jgi:hypothetical protein
MAYRIGKLMLSPSSEYFEGNQVVVGDPAYVATAGDKITMDDENWCIDTDGKLSRIAARFYGTENVIYYPTLTAAITAATTGTSSNPDVVTVLLKNITQAPITIASGRHVALTTKNATEVIIQLSGTGAMFTIGSSRSLTLSGSITLKGVSNNTSALVTLPSTSIGGTLTMNDNAKITGNTNKNSSIEAGGILTGANSNFNMNGGEISGNSCPYGIGGLAGGANFTITGGEIFGNTGKKAGGFAHITDNGSDNLTGGIIWGAVDTDVPTALSITGKVPADKANIADDEYAAVYATQMQIVFPNSNAYFGLIGPFSRTWGTNLTVWFN